MTYNGTFKCILLTVVMTSVCIMANAQDTYREVMKEYIETTPSAVQEERLLAPLNLINGQLLLGLDKDVIESIVSRYRKEILRDAILDYLLIPAFKENVSLEELQALTALNKTPEGQNYRIHEALLKEKMPGAVSSYFFDAYIAISQGDNPKDIKPNNRIPKRYIQKYYESYDTTEINSLIDSFLRLREQTEGDKIKDFVPFIKKNLGTMLLNLSYGIYTEEDLDFVKKWQKTEGGKHSVAALRTLAENANDYSKLWILSYTQWLFKQKEVCDFFLQKIADEANVNALAKALGGGDEGSVEMSETDLAINILYKGDGGELRMTNVEKEKIAKYGSGVILNGLKYDTHNESGEIMAFIMQLIANSNRNFVLRYMDDAGENIAGITIANKELVSIFDNMETYKLASKGNKLLGEKNYDEAIPLLKQAAEAGDPAAQYWLGVAYNWGNGVEEDPTEALKWYEMAAKQDNRQFKANALNEIAYVYLKQEQYEKALSVIDQAIETLPLEANYYDSKGEILFKKGDKKAARAMWDKVISLEPDFAENHDSELYKLLFSKKH